MLTISDKHSKFFYQLFELHKNPISQIIKELQYIDFYSQATSYLELSSQIKNAIFCTSITWISQYSSFQRRDIYSLLMLE